MPQCICGFGSDFLGGGGKQGGDHLDLGGIFQPAQSPDGHLLDMRIGGSDSLQESLEAGGVVVEGAEIDMEPSTTQKLEGKKAAQMIRLMEAFEDQDDVQNVWANFDIDDSLLDGA